jgi:hypothetical protein
MNRLLVGVGTLGLAGGLLCAATPALAAAKLPCAAHMSNASPKRNSRTDVLVTTSASATVTTVAHYKSTNTTHSVKATAKGQADLKYDISRATKNYRVKVTVSVKKGASVGSCTTYFTPR